MAKDPARPNVAGVITGVITGAICGTLVGWITGWWGWGLMAGIVFVVVWLISERIWWGQDEREIEDPYDGR